MRCLITWLGARDNWLFYCFNRKLSCRPLDWLMPKITALGGTLFSMGSCLLLWLWGGQVAKIAAAESVIALTGSHVLVTMVKRVTDRQRPYQVLAEVRTLAFLWKDRSFPSGHTAAAFSLAGVFGLNFPPAAVVLAGLAGLIGVSRLYLGQHYPTDVLIGGALGIVSAFGVHRLGLF